MFAKNSRYSKLSDWVAKDAQGRRVASKSLRLLPEVKGMYFHTIEETDRLDHLAYRYYKQAVKWWRICDGNPEFLAPQALLGKEPFTQIQVHVTFPGPNPAWAALLATLAVLPGVEDVRIIDAVRLVERDVMYGEEKVTITGEHPERAVLVTYNRMNVDTRRILQEVRVAGFHPGGVQEIGRVGKKIIVPPASIK